MIFTLTDREFNVLDAYETDDYLIGKYVGTIIQTLDIDVLVKSGNSDKWVHGNYIMCEDKTGYKYWFTIYDAEDSYRSDVKSLTCYSGTIDIVAEDANPIERPPTAQPFTYYFDKVFRDTGIRIGRNEIEEKVRTLEFTSENASNAEMLQYVLNGFDNAEAELIVDFDGSIPVGLVLNIYNRIGEVDPQTLLSDEDGSLLSLERTGSITHLATAIVPIGDEDEDGEQVTLLGKDYFELDDNGNVLYYSPTNHNRIYSVVGRKEFMVRLPDKDTGEFDGYINRHYRSEATTPDTLWKAALEKLKELDKPQVIYEAKGHINCTIGDNIQIISHEMKPPVRLSARVLEYKFNDDDPSRNEYTFGNYRVLDSKLDELTKYKKEVDLALSRTYRYIDRMEESVRESINHVLTTANGKNSASYGINQPIDSRDGDLWYKPVGDGETEMYQFYEGVWKLILSTLDTTKVQREVETAISEAEEAKKAAEDAYTNAVTEAERLVDEQSEAFDAKFETETSVIRNEIEQGYNDAVAEAERLVTVQDTVYQGIFEGYDSAVGDLTGSVAEADSKATDALEQAGVSSSLAQTAKEASERAETSASQAHVKAEEAIVKADDATTKADDMLATIETFEPIVTDAQVKAEEAITKANGIPDTISGIIADKGLVSGDWVDTRIDDVTGEINYELTNVKGDIPDVIMGFEWNKVSDPTLVRTDYVEDYANLDEYNLKNAEFNLSIDGIKTNITTIEQTKLDTSTYSTFKNNEYANDVSGIRQRITHVETNKLDDEEFRTFKEHDYEVTVAGFSGDITEIKRDKMNTSSFNTFKTNVFDATVNGLNGRIESVEFDKLDTSDFTNFKSNEYQTTVDGMAGQITAIERDKLDTVDFDSFKSNDYQLTVDGFNMELTNISGSVPDYVLGVEWYLSDDPTLIRTNYVEEVDLTNYDNPDYVMGIEWDGISNPSLTRTDNTEDLTSKKEFEVFLGDYNFSAEGWNATNTYVTNNKTQINNLISNASGWQQTISYVDANQTKFNETISQVDSYKQTIGSNGEKITQVVMTDNAFITKVGELEGLAEDVILGVEWERVPSPVMARTGYMDDWTETQVAQISDSWVLTIKSGSDIKTQINATTDGIRLESKLTHLAGDSLIDNAVIKSSHIDSLNVSKLTGTSAEFITLRSKVITADSITSEYLKVDNALIDKLTVDTAVVDRFFSKTAVIDNLTAKTLTAITANITSIRSQMLVSDVISSEHIQGGTAMVGKLFSSTASINELTSKAAFINNIKAIEISADKVTTGELDAANVNIINLNVSSIVGLDSEFVQSAWNGINTRINIDATAFTASDSEGNQAIINTSGEIRSTAGGTDQTRGVFHKGRIWFHTTSGSAVLNIGAHPVVGEGVNRGSIATARAEKLVIGRYNDYLTTNINAKVNPYITLEYGATLGDESNAFTKVWHNLSMSGKFINDVQQVSGFELAVRATSGRLMLGVTGYNTLQVGQANTRSFGNIEMQPGYEVTQASDRRWKDIVGKTETNALEEIKKLSVVDYYWKNGDGEKQFGLIAQDSPFLSVINEDGYYGISGNKLAMLNLLSSQELCERIEALEEEIKLLKSA